MKKKFGNSSKALSKDAQRRINGGLLWNCWCIFPADAGPCWHIYWNKPCGVQQGQYVICNEGGCGGGGGVEV